MAIGNKRQLDEESGFDRPSKRGSRPRTKQRPGHEDATLAMVVAVDRGRYTLAVDGDLSVTAMKARELRDRIVVGDKVAVVGDVTGNPDALARIVRIEPRTSVLRRTADDTDPFERIVVANADQLVIVVACANPEPRVGMIDRAVVAAYDAGMSATLVLTKADLGSPLALMELYEPAGVQVVVTEPQVGADGGEIRVSAGMARPTLTLQPGALELVRQVLEGKVSVLLGHSGVGKSTLVNALVPGAGRATGAVNDVTGRGRQTSTSVVALPLPAEAGWVIDTPGIRSLGIAHVQTEHVLAAFPELALVAEDECPRGCTHLPSAPDCALDEWVLGTDAGLGSVSGFGEVEAAGGVDPFGAAENSGGASLAVGVSLAGEAVSGRALRLASLRRLLEAREGAAAALALHASQVARRSV